MTRDIIEIKRGIAQAKAALDLLEKFVAEYESRTVNILPHEDVVFCRATDDEVIAGQGLSPQQSLNQAIRDCAERLAAAEHA